MAAPPDAVPHAPRGAPTWMPRTSRGMTVLIMIPTIYSHRPACPGDPRRRRDGCFPNEPDSRGTSRRSEEHTSELQSLMRNSYAVFCLKKKKQTENEQVPMSSTRTT